MRNFRLTVLMLALLGVLVTSCNKDDNGGDTPNNQSTEVGGVSISLNQTNIITNAGESTQLVATIAPDNATNKEITWESSNSKVVSVDVNGKLMAEARGGTAVITAKVGDKTASCTVNVIPEGMTITNGELTAMDKTKIPTDGILGIPAIVSEIGDEAFKDCASLKGISIPNSVKTIKWRAFYKCTGLTSIEFPNSGTISIGEYAFASCEGLTSIEFPNSVTNMEDSCFSGCKALTSIKFSNSNIKVIGRFAFSSCIALTSVELPDSLISIEGHVFLDCKALTSITIPANVTKIGEDLRYGPFPAGIFKNCTALETVICMPTTPPTLFNDRGNSNNNFESTPASLKIKVPAASVEAYKTAALWSDIAGQIEAHIRSRSPR